MIEFWNTLIIFVKSIFLIEFMHSCFRQHHSFTNLEVAYANAQSYDNGKSNLYTEQKKSNKISWDDTHHEQMLKSLVVTWCHAPVCVACLFLIFNSSHKHRFFFFLLFIYFFFGDKLMFFLETNSEFQFFWRHFLTFFLEAYSNFFGDILNIYQGQTDWIFLIRYSFAGSVEKWGSE